MQSVPTHVCRPLRDTLEREEGTSVGSLSYTCPGVMRPLLAGPGNSGSLELMGVLTCPQAPASGGCLEEQRYLLGEAEVGQSLGGGGGVGIFSPGPAFHSREFVGALSFLVKKWLIFRQVAGDLRLWKLGMRGLLSLYTHFQGKDGEVEAAADGEVTIIEDNNTC